jgi:hypothetical protein
LNKLQDLVRGTAWVESWEEFELGDTLYHNPLSSPEHVKGFRLEGEASLTFPSQRLRMENSLHADEGQKSNFVYWCNESFPSDVAVSWDFWPIREPGLCILFFSAMGRQGQDLFHPDLAPRSGSYEQYNRSDINAYHISYFRRKYPDERAFHLCNLRKSYGFHLVSQGPDPIPNVEDCQSPYSIMLYKCGAEIRFYINKLEIFRWTDDGHSYGDVLQGGKIGFRQMAPLIAEYANLHVRALRKR